MIQTIEKIHKEFDESHIFLQDLLNVENTELVKIQEEHAQKYADMEVYKHVIDTAFKNIDITKEVSNVNEHKVELENKIKFNANKIAAIKTHNELLPFYKFLTVGQLYKILDKYNLFVGKSDLYTGSIPSKNAKDFVDFDNKLKTDYIRGKIPQCNHDNWRSDMLCQMDKYATGNMFLPYFIVAPEDNFLVASDIYTVGNEKFKGTNFNFKDFRSDAKAERERLKDPVILKPFIWKGCLLLTIVTKWGLEANIDEFKNAIDN